MPATTPVRTGSTPASPSLLQWVGFEARPGTVDGFARGFSMSRETSSRLVEEFVRPRHRDDLLDGAPLRRHRTPPIHLHSPADLREGGPITGRPVGHHTLVLAGRSHGLSLALADLVDRMRPGNR